ncbi:hypothetical protein LTR37_018718 [Vermiconidia calcicola]|uniref:Uncharacterized protein n=1 Tax=Vermiconidia calcicola TaxID=1690605 RepID=A0ACC3MHC5_9PEZI|nr:hypothetical protein LTR37_018718 [Vermiconidia calcicola]
MFQTPYQPLEPYQHPRSFDRRCRPWQQMLIFFVRTQKQQDWRSPTNRFRRRQDAAFHNLIAAAEEIVDENEESEEEGERDDEAGSVAEQQAGTKVAYTGITGNYVPSLLPMYGPCSAKPQFVSRPEYTTFPRGLRRAPLARRTCHMPHWRDARATMIYPSVKV